MSPFIVMFCVLQATFAAKKHVSGAIFNGIGVFIQSSTYLFQSIIFEMRKNTERLFGEPLFLSILLIDASIKFNIFLFIISSVLVVFVMLLFTRNVVLNISFYNYCAIKLPELVIDENSVNCVKRDSSQSNNTNTNTTSNWKSRTNGKISKDTRLSAEAGNTNTNNKHRQTPIHNASCENNTKDQTAMAVDENFG